MVKKESTEKENFMKLSVESTCRFTKVVCNIFITSTSQTEVHGLNLIMLRR